ncbi:MAG: response regulator transcription factor [Phycisphaerales bacterium]|nr:response regulator transcription factor [Phycisphaerales bacterium]
MAGEQTIYVAIVEDDRATREGLKVLIDGTPGFRCQAAYGSVEQALAARLLRPPAVALLDIQLAGMSGVEGVKALREHWAGSVIVMLTAFGDDDNVFRSIASSKSLAARW